MPGTYLLIGPPGSGKTTLACTLEHPTLIVDVDCKAHRMENIRHLVDSGEVTILPINKPLIEEQSFRERALHPDLGLRKQPEGYLYTVDIFNAIIDHAPEYEQYKTIVLDSLTRLAEHLKRLMIYLKTMGKFGKKAKESDGDMNWPSWGSYLSNWEELFTALCQMERNFICCAHLSTETEKDELTNTEIVLGYWPMLDGQAKKKLTGYFDETYYLAEEKGKKDETGKEVRYWYRTAGGGKKYHARTSMDLPEFMPSTSLLEVVKKHTRPKTT